MFCDIQFFSSPGVGVSIGIDRMLKFLCDGQVAIRRVILYADRSCFHVKEAYDIDEHSFRLKTGDHIVTEHTPALVITTICFECTCNSY